MQQGGLFIMKVMRTEDRHWSDIAGTPKAGVLRMSLLEVRNVKRVLSPDSLLFLILL